ncbi:hypothetical protein TBLA_0B04450 [Henningerozyma blattae CBS 6284]|uniref:AB hydrolase-1 domain-containing protein n=1 Tax=Henningerozyma blattae (strain ATCC 34711 / CBS 6284 / DSM 70876 / NBRC 10599 / NRRL Y-10934 / UCD 77-7) TaxID=1071380 RepID=I2GYT0_HENB6|nr:hypothetical protein TBLA_0B04450 [Tetrapisispora blattae CBS 6284]CCH59282.1 hypothetical protein TBLA_0B04450 [Tetrapisispora blattae CBS 6284]
MDRQGLGTMSIPMINPFNWGYNGTVKHIISQDGTTALNLKDSKGTLQFHQFVSDNIPTLRNGSNFKLNPFLFTGILQTMYLASADFSSKFNVFYGREIKNFSDDGIATIDWVMTKHWQKQYNITETSNGGMKFDTDKFETDRQETHPADWPRLHPRTRFLKKEELDLIHDDPSEFKKPLVIIIHGVAGGSHEPIIRSLAQEISSINNGNKFQVCVLNARGCARSKISNKKLYSALHIQDMEEFIKTQKLQYPNRKIYAVGFSFGAAQLGNYLGMRGENTALNAACTVSGPWDLVSSCLKLKQDFWSNKLFSKAITQFLTRLVKVNMGELEVPEGYEPECKPTPENPIFYTCTKSNVKKAKTLTSTIEFDGMFTAPSLGFNSALEYYREASPRNNLENIKTPTLVINSTDDPIIGLESIPIESKMNPNILLCETDLGGHLAYLDSNYDSWMTKQVAQFFYKFDELVL